MSDRPKRRGSRWGAAAAILIVLAGGGVLALRAVLTPERLRDQVVRATENATGLDAELAAARLSMLPFGISVEEFTLTDDANAAEPFVSIDAALVRLQLLPLLRRTFVVDAIELESPVVTLHREGDAVKLPGTLGEPPARAPDGASASPGFTGVIERLRLTDGALHVRTPGGAEDVHLSGIGLTARLDATTPGTLRAAGELELAGLSLSALEAYRPTLDRLHPVTNFELEYRPEAGTVALTSVRLRAQPLDLSLHGQVAGLPDAPTLDLTMDPQELTLEELLPLIPPSAFPEGRVPEASGPVTVSARIQGPLGSPETPPTVLAEVRFGGADLGMQGFPVGVKNVRGAVRASATELELIDVTAGLGEGSLAVNGTVRGLDTPEAATYDLAVRGNADLSLVEQTGFAPEGVSLAGRVDVDARVRGAAEDPQAAQLDGEIVLSNARYSAPTLAHPVTGLAGKAVLRGADVTLEGVTAQVGRSSFTGSGRVTRALSPKPEISFHGRSGTFDLVEWTPEVGTTTGGAGTQGAATTPADVPLIPPLPDVVADLKLDVDSLLTVGATLADVSMTARLGDRKAHVNASAKDGLFGEGVRMSGLTAAVDIVDQTMSGNFSAPAVEAHRIPLTGLRGNLNLGADKKLAFRDVTANLYTGVVAGRADVDLATPGKPLFSIETEAKGVEANSFVSTLTPADDFLFGKLDLKSSFSGGGATPDEIAASLIGDGTLTATEGRLNRGPQTQAIWRALNLEEQESIPFRDLFTKFAVSTGRLETKDLVVAGGDAQWAADGFVGFDGKLDYFVQVSLNEALSTRFRQRVGRDLAALLEGTGGNVVLDLRVTGDVAKPAVSLDRDKLAERASQNAADALKNEIEKGKEALGGKLKKLLGG